MEATMHFEGDFEVLVHLFKKQQLLATGNSAHKAIRPLLLILSGTMRGVYGGGQVSALENFGLQDAFDSVIGVSTGAPTAAYFLARQAHEGTRIYSEECTKSDFISLRRFFAGGPLADTAYLARVFRGEMSRQALDQSAIQASRTDFFVGVTCARSGKGELVDAKRARPDVVEAIHASIALPGLSPGSVVLDGKPYVDGAGALPLPVRLVVERFQPTDLLVLANRPLGYRGGTAEQLLSVFTMKSLPRGVRSAFLSRRRIFDDELEYLRLQKSCRYALLWSDNMIGSFTRKPRIIVSAGRRAKHHLTDLLLAARAQCPAL